MYKARKEETTLLFHTIEKILRVHHNQIYVLAYYLLTDHTLVIQINHILSLIYFSCFHFYALQMNFRKTSDNVVDCFL